MAGVDSKAKRIPLRERRKLLHAFRKEYGITLVELGTIADVSHPMLSQFERGQRDLSSDSWARVLRAMNKLLKEDEEKRKTQMSKAQEIARKLFKTDEQLWAELEDFHRRVGSMDAKALSEEISRNDPFLKHARYSTMTDDEIASDLEAKPAKQELPYSLRVFQAVLTGRPLSAEEKDFVQQSSRDRVRKLRTLPARWLEHPVIKELMESYQREIEFLKEDKAHSQPSKKSRK